MREIVIFACGKCKRRNYSATKNKKASTDKISLKKYCRSCQAHTDHAELKK